MEKLTFIKLLLPGAKEVMKKFHILISIIIVQAILESGWGEHAPGFNLFGIKWTEGCGHDSQELKTSEFYNQKQFDALKASGKWYELVEKTNEGEYHVHIKALFRKYKSYAESMLDHAELIATAVVDPHGEIKVLRYQAVMDAKNFTDACCQLQRCGYATDPDYAQKLSSIITSNKIDQYDVIPQPVDYKSLSKGSEGTDVKELQRQLNKLGNKLVVDGCFGVKTKNAVIAFQTQHHITIDGIVGKVTILEINKALSK